MELVTKQLDLIRLTINEQLTGVEPWKVAVGSAASAWLAAFVYLQLTHKTPLIKRFKKSLFRLVRKLPPVKSRIEKEMKDVSETNIFLIEFTAFSRTHSFYDETPIMPSSYSRK